MPMNNATADFEVEHERSHFHGLLAANPNYFGTLPDLGRGLMPPSVSS